MGWGREENGIGGDERRGNGERRRRVGGDGRGVRREEKVKMEGRESEKKEKKGESKERGKRGGWKRKQKGKGDEFYEERQMGGRERGGEWRNEPIDIETDGGREWKMEIKGK